jgi:hypothetical protein
MKSILITFSILLLTNFVFSQNVGIGIATPDASAKLHVSSTSSGLLIPNVTLTDVSVAAPITSPATGLLVWNTNVSVTGGTGSGYYYWNGVSWTKLATEPVASNINGDVKHSFASADHSGWVKLDGRLLSSLSADQQAVAATLGFTGNLPNATNKVLKQNGAVNNTGGSNTTTIAQANLPNVNLTGYTSFSGSHVHFFQDYGYSNQGTSGDPLDDNAGFTPSDITKDDYDYHPTNPSGSHNHTVTVSTGGSGTALNIENPYLTANVFIYIGL